MYIRISVFHIHTYIHACIYIHTYITQTERKTIHTHLLLNSFILTSISPLTSGPPASKSMHNAINICTYYPYTCMSDIICISLLGQSFKWYQILVGPRSSSLELHRDSSTYMCSSSMYAHPLKQKLILTCPVGYIAAAINKLHRCFVHMYLPNSKYSKYSNSTDTANWRLY